LSDNKNLIMYKKFLDLNQVYMEKQEFMDF